MQYYDFISKGYNELHEEEQIGKLSIIKKNIKISKETKILDVGCGTGISSDFDCFVIGIDPSIELLKQNRRKEKLIGVAESLPFKNNYFDYVISVTSMHNFKNIKKSIDEVKRVCRGNFVFSVLKKAKKIAYIKRVIEKNFKVNKIIDEEKDIIFFCHDKF